MMPVMDREGMDGRMGLAYVPFTFPTVSVALNMQKAGVNASYSQVDGLWTSYKELVLKDGMTAYKPDQTAGNGAILSALQKKTGYSPMMVAAFLNATALAVKQGVSSEYINPAPYGASGLGPVFDIASDVTKAVGTNAGNVVGPVTDFVKYAALALAAGGVIYLVYQGSKFIKKKGA